MESLPNFYIPETVVFEDNVTIRISLSPWVPLNHIISLGPERHIIHRLVADLGQFEPSPRLMEFESSILYLLFVRKLAEQTTRPSSKQKDDAIEIAKRAREPLTSPVFEETESAPTLLGILHALYGKQRIDEVLSEIEAIRLHPAWKIREWKATNRNKARVPHEAMNSELNPARDITPTFAKLVV